MNDNALTTEVLEEGVRLALVRWPTQAISLHQVVHSIKTSRWDRKQDSCIYSEISWEYTSRLDQDTSCTKKGTKCKTKPEFQHSLNIKVLEIFFLPQRVLQNLFRSDLFLGLHKWCCWSWCWRHWSVIMLLIIKLTIGENAQMLSPTAGDLPMSYWLLWSEVWWVRARLPGVNIILIIVIIIFKIIIVMITNKD